MIFGKRITKIEKINEIKKPIGVSNDTNSSCKKAQYKVNNVSFVRKKVQKPSLQQTHWECREVELLNSFLRTFLLTLAAVSNGDLLGGLAALGAIRLDLKNNKNLKLEQFAKVYMYK